MSQSPTPLSDCCNAPTVLCEGTVWDVPLSSVRAGSTYSYGCSECHEMCGIAASAGDDMPTERRDDNSEHSDAPKDFEILCPEKHEMPSRSSTTNSNLLGRIMTPDPTDNQLRQRFHEIAKSYYGYISGSNPDFDKAMWNAMLDQMLDAVTSHDAALADRIEKLQTYKMFDDAKQPKLVELKEVSALVRGETGN